MRDLLHGTVYLIIFNPSLTLPVSNDSSKLFCFLHALIIELCNVSQTIVQIDTKPYYDDDDDDELLSKVDWHVLQTTVLGDITQSTHCYHRTSAITIHHKWQQKRHTNKQVRQHDTNPQCGGAVKTMCNIIAPFFNKWHIFLLIMDSSGGLLPRDLHFQKALVELMLSSN